MADIERQQDEVQDRDEAKQQSDNEQGGSSGIHKYFGKSNKSIKFLSAKLKKSFKLQNYQNVSLSLETNANSQKQLSKTHQKTKLKCQYRWSSDFLKAKPKFKLSLNPFLKHKLFEEALVNWKSVIDKMNEQNIDIKINEKKQLNLKYKRTKWHLDRKLKHKLEFQTTFESDYNMKNSVSFQSTLKQALFENHKYINSSQIKSKVALKDFNYKLLTPAYKFDFAQKLTFIINQYKAKQQTKVAMSFGSKESIDVKSNLEITNPSNTWTLYGSVYGYKWGVALDEIKFIYSLFDKWKIGFMIGQKSSWEVMIQNPKLNKEYCNSLALHVGNKNYALILKNKFNRKKLGRVNVELSLQNPLKNIRLDRINCGLTANFNI